MNIHIDLLHPAHINLFKGFIKENIGKHNFIVTCINRGKVPLIAKQELKGIDVKIIGTHKGTKLSIILQANIIRFFQLMFYLIGKKIDLGLSFGSFISGANMRLRGIPNIHFSDDPERKINSILEELTSTARYMPPLIAPQGRIKIFNALKEWAYLSPKSFTSNNLVLDKYGLTSKNYIFVREVSTGSLNYINQEKNVIASVSDLFPTEIPVLLSLEDKSTRSQYPKSWIVLEEPVKDIHSLIYYSIFTISSGDSIAREGAMLGVPSLYCGFRDMKANELLIEKGMLFKVGPTDIGNMIGKVKTGEIEIIPQEKFRNQLLLEWVDVNDFIEKIVFEEIKKTRNKN